MLAIDTPLDEKVLAHFEDRRAVVHKGIAHYGEQFRRLPRFVADFLIATYVDPSDSAPGIAKIDRLLAEHYVDSDEKELVKSRIRERGSYKLFGQARARYEASRDAYWAEIPAIGETNVRIAPEILGRYGEALLTAGCWGTITVAYDARFRLGKQHYPFFITSFAPLQITRIDVDAWIEARNHFTASEWIDLLVTSVGFDPARLDDAAKLLYLSRLVPLIESNVNLIELGPPESGKTYTYRSMSTYSFVVSGSNTTMASLFYNKLRRRVGLIGYRDCILFDEIAHADLNKHDMIDIVNTLKDFMGSGKFGRDADEFSGECSIVLAGNIETDRAKRSVGGCHRHLFAPLPPILGQDRAFLDRIHGYIPGWLAPQIAPANFATGYGFMADYLSEILHRMRARSFAAVLADRVDFNGMGHRNQTAIGRIASGLLKLVYPHRTTETVQRNELAWALDVAVDLRQRVVDQLAIISPGEFAGTRLTYRS